jgi:hypothetical protein
MYLTEDGNEKTEMVKSVNQQLEKNRFKKIGTLFVHCY